MCGCEISFKLRFLVIFLPCVFLIFNFSITEPKINSYALTEADAKYDYTRTYGCQNYDGDMIHCDFLLNKLQSYEINGISSKVYTPNSQPKFVDGKYLKAIEMHANRLESIEVNNSKNMNSLKFSVSFWIKRLANAEPNGIIISHSNYTQTAGWYFQMLSNGNVSFAITNKIGEIFSTPDIRIPVGHYIHIVGVFDGSTVEIYKDGVLEGKTVFRGTFVADSKSPLRIGSKGGSMGETLWTGVIDDLLLYNRTLSGKEIKDIFTNNLVYNVSTGLVGHWKFDGDLSYTDGKYNDTALFRTLITSMSFTPDGRLFFCEKNTGNIRIMKNEKVLETPFVRIPDVFVSWEQGLLGLTIDPDFQENHYVYAYYTSINNNKVVNKVVRFMEANNTAHNNVTILDNIPASHGYHSGGALAFGKDEKLYITVGDATYPPYAQDPSVLVGKILRINRDGTIPNDNPYPTSPIYTLGHRNMFGIAFDKENGIGIATENGDALYDEINLIKKGGNYGFPTLQPPNLAPEFSNSSSSILPLRSYWKTIGPTQAIYYTGAKFPELKEKFLFAAFNGNLYALKLDRDNHRIIEEENIALGLYPYSAITGLAQSPDGDIYFSSFDIYKLTSINSQSKFPVLFPVQLNSTEEVQIETLQMDKNMNSKRLTIDLNTYDNVGTSFSSDTAYIYVRVGIPKVIFGHYNVLNITSDNPVEYNINNDTNPLVIVTFKLSHGENYHLQIVAT